MKEKELIKMATTHIESIMRNSASTHNGWTKLTDENLSKETGSKSFRQITIGSEKNCNSDSLICDCTTEKKIKNIMEKFNIINYKINNIHTEYIFGTQLILNENEYVSFVEKLL